MSSGGFLIAGEYLRNKKPPLLRVGVLSAFGTCKESDDDLLSQAGAYYHWRGSVSPSCSGWEGVVPHGYGRQTKGWGSSRLTGPRIRIVWGADRSCCRLGRHVWKKVLGWFCTVLAHCIALH